MPEWLKDWGTLVIAVYGAVTATIGIVINWLNRRDTRRETERSRLAEAPYATLAITNGDEKGRMVNATFWNPSPHEVLIETVEVVKPRGWRAVPINPGIGVSLTARVAEASRKIAYSFRIGPHPDDKNKPTISVRLIVAAPDWSEETIGAWPGGVKHLPNLPILVVFRGRIRSASRDAVQIEASA